MGAPKYRKWILRGNIRKRVKDIFQEIAERHEFAIDTLEVAGDHVHTFLSFPTRYSISKVVGMLRSISASVIFKEHPEVEKELWRGEFWGDGYFARTVGDEVAAKVIKKYIKYHQEREGSTKHLGLF